MQALNFYVIVEKIKEAPRTVGGLEMTDAQDKEVRYLKGKVVSVGHAVPVVAAGDIVKYDRHAGHGIEENGVLYMLMRGDDLVTICDED